MRSHSRFCLLSASLLPLFTAGALTAQVQRIVPAEYANGWAGNNGSGAGISSTKSIAQNVYRTPVAANGLIFGVAWRRHANTTDFNSSTRDVEVTLCSTTADRGTLSSTFASNLNASATVVVPRQVINLPAVPANAGPDGGWFGFPLTTPWAFTGPNLLVETKTFAASYVIDYRTDRCFESTSGEALTFGSTNCGSATINSTSTGGTYIGGSNVAISLAAAPSNVPAILLLGSNMRTFAGLPLPIDLAPIGVPGCLLYVEPLANLTVGTDATGTASITIPMPLGIPGTVPLAFQWMYNDPASTAPVPVAATNARYIQTGPRVCTNTYVYDLFSETAVTGTIQAGGPIMRLSAVP